MSLAAPCGPCEPRAGNRPPCAFLAAGGPWLCAGPQHQNPLNTPTCARACARCLRSPIRDGGPGAGPAPVLTGTCMALCCFELGIPSLCRISMHMPTAQLQRRGQPPAAARTSCAGNSKFWGFGFTCPHCASQGERDKTAQLTSPKWICLWQLCEPCPFILVGLVT